MKVQYKQPTSDKRDLIKTRTFPLFSWKDSEKAFLALKGQNRHRQSRNEKKKC